MSSDVTKPLRHPVVLLHGLGGFDRLRLEVGRNLRASIRYFHKVDRALMRGGAPEVLSASLPPTGSIEARATALRQFLDVRLGQGRCHLLAHSMGGLDARFYLTHMGGAERVVSLTTLGTPHRGSPIAEVALDVLLNRYAALMHRFGITSEFRRIFRRMAAHRDLRPSACARFNVDTPDMPGVAYFSYGGAPPAEAVHWIFRITHEILVRQYGQTVNDGLVGLDSARWTGWQGAVAADHLSMTGWQLFEPARRHFDVQEFFAGLTRLMRQAESGADAGPT